MNQILNIANTASTHAAIGYARKLAAEGKTQSQIGFMVRAAGYRITEVDVAEVWLSYQRHNKAFLEALRAGE